MERRKNIEKFRVFDLLDIIEKKWGKQKAVLSEKKNGKWIDHTLETYKRNAENLAKAFIKIGLKPGDKIASVSNNRPEWNFLDMASAMAGLVHVPIYPTISNDDFEYIFDHSDAKLLFISDKLLYRKLKPIADKTSSIDEVYTFNEVEGAKNWKELLKTGEEAEEVYARKLEERKANVSPDDVFTMIYTSGTTSRPKGVMLTHWNFTYQIIRLSEMVPDITPEDYGLSFLPLCHVFERVVNYIMHYLGVKIHYAEGLHKLADNMKEVRPHLMASVPRVLERVYDKIIAKAKMLPPSKQKLFFWALRLGEEFEFKGKSIFYKAQLALANSLVFSQWRKALGGRIKYIISGGAALAPRLARIFWAAGIPVREGYGLTETAPVICFNGTPPNDIKIGTVGRKIGPEIELKIADDGEILFKGPNLMKGYYKNEELTKEVIDQDGWFHTGDVGIIDEDGFLKITDRKKEIFKLSNGKYIAPQIIENMLKESPYIEQAMIVGENEKFAGALISPNFEMLHSWAYENKITFKNNEELVRNEEVIKLYKDEIAKVNKKLGQYERVNVFRIVCKEWSPASGELSPTLKLKRRVIKEKFGHLIDEMYKK